MSAILHVFCVLRASAWGALLCWVALVLLFWLRSQPETSIHQSVLAAQIAALLVAGYAVAKAITQALTEVEKVIKHHME